MLRCYRKKKILGKEAPHSPQGISYGILSFDVELYQNFQRFIQKVFFNVIWIKILNVFYTVFFSETSFFMDFIVYFHVEVLIKIFKIFHGNFDKNSQGISIVFSVKFDSQCISCSFLTSKPYTKFSRILSSVFLM